MGDIGRYFDRAEFSCKCKCGKDDVKPSLVMMLDLLRENVGRPLVVTSGVRCEAYNAKVGGVDSSAHIDGLAADIAVGDGHDRLSLISSALTVGFRRIGVAKGFVHVDVDYSKPTNTMWVYQ